MKRRIPKKRIPKRAPRHGLARLAHTLQHPKFSFFVVVVCLLIVVLNWAITRSAWDPEVGATLSPVPPVEQTPSQVAQESPTSLSAWDYFYPAWNSHPPTPLIAHTAFHPTIGTVEDHALHTFMRDPHQRIDDDFVVTPELAPRVLFWLRVHTQLTSSMRLIHDRNNPSIVYGIADFTPVFERAESKAQALTVAYRLERAILTELKNRLNEATGLSKTQDITPWERAQILALLSNHGALAKTEAYRLVRSVRSQTGQRDEFEAALKRSENLLPYIEATFRSHGLPVELARIPFVESSFNPRAYSKVGATGMWQFMPYTARQMISENQALWSDPLRQTRAAARILLIYRSLLPDWSTTVTSYNSGVGRLQRLVREHRARHIGPILSAERGLGFAGKNFYAQFLSANIADRYRHELFPRLSHQTTEPLLAFEPPTSFSRAWRR